MTASRSTTVAAAALALALAGCGPGLSVRGRSPSVTDIGRGATSAGPSSGPEPSAGRGGPGAGSAFPDPNDEHAHDDELPALPGPDDAESASSASPANVGLGGVPQASRYGALDRNSCEAELGKRKIPYERVGEARGVVAPLRLKGPIAGIEFHSMLPASQRRTSPYEIYDCRLVLALDDWARVLARHDIVEVVHYSVYRPPTARQVLTGPGRRHTGALAIDAAIFKTRDGRSMSVEKDFHGHIGSKPCGPSAAKPLIPSTEAVTLREVVCEAADAQLFNVMLTPDYNWPHRNHFHLEVTAGVRWVLVR